MENRCLKKYFSFYNSFQSLALPFFGKLIELVSKVLTACNYSITTGILFKLRMFENMKFQIRASCWFTERRIRSRLWKQISSFEMSSISSENALSTRTSWHSQFFIPRRLIFFFVWHGKVDLSKCLCSYTCAGTSDIKSFIIWDFFGVKSKNYSFS